MGNGTQLVFNPFLLSRLRSDTLQASGTPLPTYMVGRQAAFHLDIPRIKATTPRPELRLEVSKRLSCQSNVVECQDDKSLKH
jgi:hypothetical protein